MAAREPRKNISKKIRFEVFKRDSFKCQYCGQVSPDVLLHVDHIKPVAEGGANELVNLITACQACNLGKGARTLDDKSVITKTRNQMEELQERREQIEMMMEWHTGLKKIELEATQKLVEYWEEYTPGLAVSDVGVNQIKKWQKKFQFSDILSAMDIAANQYLEFEEDGFCNRQSFAKGFSKIAGIIRVKKEEVNNPHIGDLLYIRGILNNRCHYFNPSKAMQILKEVYSWGEDIAHIKEMAYSVKNWSQFINWYAEKQNQYLGEDS